jgi:hypothetical protein
MQTTNDILATEIEEQRSVDDMGSPECCQPMTDALWAERGERLRVAHDAAVAAQPKACPRCGDPRPFPTFLAPDEYECSNRDCCAVWTVDR